ncbi:MAG: efflux RND transporter permease subunit [Myxococcales bacterium]|nr:efflux RND transporter permease subunit [Myxococcales bacterium]
MTPKEANAQAMSALKKGPIAWMTNNAVAANLLMIVLIVGGLFVGRSVKQEVFPEVELDVINISVPYPGASPSEVEEGIILAVEEAVRGVDGIKQVTSQANESAASIRVELMLGADKDRALNDIKSAVDRITSLPKDAERPVVALLVRRSEVISLMVYGDAEEALLRQLAESMRTQLLASHKITQAEVSGVRKLEISVEVPQDKLREYNLTLDQVATAVRVGAVDLPGGAVKTQGGEILVRTTERRNRGQEFSDIPVISRPDGTSVRLGDIARIVDGFEESDSATTYNGKPAARVQVYRVADQTPVEIADAVRAFLPKALPNLPEGVKVATWNDRSQTFRDRVDLLRRNAIMGLIMVLVALGLFLEVRLAFWVTMGIPISFMGALLLMPVMDVSINMISLFAFIVTLGIVVDDAIVVGESIYHRIQAGERGLEAAINGAHEVAVPVVFSILTTITAFMPLFFVPGFSGKLFRNIPAIVVSVLIISLIESLFVLPAHLGHMRQARGEGLFAFLAKQQGKVSTGLERFIEVIYTPIVKTAGRWRYTTVGLGIASLIVAVGLIAGGRIEFSFLPAVQGDMITANATLPFGSPVARTRVVKDRIMEAADRVLARHGGGKIRRGMYGRVGSLAARRGHGGGSASGGSHLTSAQLFLVPMDKRAVTAEQIANEWRAEVGELAGVESLTFVYKTGPSAGQPVHVELRHRDLATLERAAEQLAGHLATYAGVKDIDDGFSAGKPQLDFKLRPEAASLGITAATLGRQLRGSFYGIEALRQQRGRDEIRVMVRLPEAARRSERDIEQLMLRGQGGQEIALAEAAEVRRGHSYTSIVRIDGARTVDVTAEMDKGKGSSGKVLHALKTNYLPELMASFPGLDYKFGGSRRQRNDSLSSLARGFMFAMIIIYALLAIPFRSYVQPAVVMSAIPFGIVGAVAGHLLMGFELSVISMMGIVALSGVVVNDSLVLVDTANRRRRRTGDSHFDVITWAAARRFRPIMLTSLTTFLGLAPMIMETSVQARFLVPMAISLGFGIIVATFIVLLLVPSFYLIVEDVRGVYTERDIYQPVSRPEEATVVLPAVQPLLPSEN